MAVTIEKLWGSHRVTLTTDPEGRGRLNAVLCISGGSWETHFEVVPAGRHGKVTTSLATAIREYNRMLNEGEGEE